MSSLMRVKTWAPGSSMLMGEYAVTIPGFSALIAPLNVGVSLELVAHCAPLGPREEIERGEGRGGGEERGAPRSLWNPSSSPSLSIIEVVIEGPLGREEGQIKLAVDPNFRSEVYWQPRRGAKLEKSSAQARYRFGWALLQHWCALPQVAPLLLSERGPIQLVLRSTTEFSLHQGLGSSAAFVAALLKALRVLQKDWLKKQKGDLGGALGLEELQEPQLFALGRKAILQVQKRGSCADLAASLVGEPLLYRQAAIIDKEDPALKEVSFAHFLTSMQRGGANAERRKPLEATGDKSEDQAIFALLPKKRTRCYFSPLATVDGTASNTTASGEVSKEAKRGIKREAEREIRATLHWIYMGYKTSTEQMLSQLAITEREALASEANLHQLLEALFEEQESGREDLKQQKQQLREAMLAFSSAQQLLDRLGCLDGATAQLANCFSSYPWPSESQRALKISGSGHGDCLLIWGDDSINEQSVERFVAQTRERFPSDLGKIDYLSHLYIGGKR